MLNILNYRGAASLFGERRRQPPDSIISEAREDKWTLYRAVLQF